MCAFDGCGPIAGRPRRGLCQAHYEQQRKGLPLAPVRWRRGAKDGATCSFGGCTKQVQSVGLCSGHYEQRKRGRPLAPLRERVSYDGCGFDGCENAHSSRGYCSGHYGQVVEGRDLAPLREVRNPAARDDAGRKQCRACDVWLAPDEFSRDRHHSDGFKRECKRCVRDRYLRRQYGLTADRFDEMLAQQDGVCAVCGAPDPAGRELAVDHDHACCPTPGQSCGACVRGLLCWPCNVGIGHLRDDPEILKAAASYLAAA
ncbi:endonuclease VII domain-containing protein [Streptomyces longwoodensis]|uniref:endonuclease VII domain-containing protein n=1 Tax=Streptomyces longwoodensis TaxID=68231 RepID=UPI0033E33082